MATSKKNRQLIFNKYKGRCAYCGCELEKGWHVDELLPVKRIIGDYGVWTGKYEHPERLTINNQMPSCPSCNINKHSMTLEDFRGLVAGFMFHLNHRNTQYKIAKRYGLIEETIKPIIFHFEK